MATELIVLGKAQLGYLEEIISSLEIASTLKQIKTYKRQIFSALYAIKPLKLSKFKYDDLSYIRRCYNAKQQDMTWEFWYERTDNEYA